MMGGNLGMRQHDFIIWESSNGYFRVTQADRGYRRQFVLCLAFSVMIGNGDESAILVANTEDISLGEHFSEVFIATDFAALIEESVEGFLTLLMWMDQDELVALANNLHMLS